MTDARPDLRAVLCAALADWRAAWSVGAFGAIAEFHQAQGEAPRIDDPAGLTRATARGAVRIDRLDNVIPVACETLNRQPDSWGHAVALCLAEAEAARASRTTLTEIGPDADAILPHDKGSLLFDMGLGLAQVDFCVRTADPELIRALRAGAGRPVFDPASPALAAILSRHPHRVALSSVGRVEVFQKIGGPETGGVSPEGPHTHVLPKLLAARRTHAATMPIPEGLVPCAMLHPAHPLRDPLGRSTPFDAEAHAAFARLSAVWAPAVAASVKTAALTALEAGQAAEDFPAPQDRHARAALRIALRQQRWVKGPDPLLDAWRAHFDRVAAEDETGEEAGENA
ncbi:DUF6925 family protein [Rubrimonas sp.]|uniref:DUF6925 family protein n=1 Tax=Rubrimonas sp. TaxID=2036015 RepID=UPI002FDDAE22